MSAALLEESVAAPAAFLDLIHGEVGAVHQQLRCVAVIGVDAYSDAGADVQLAALDQVRRCQCGEDLFRHQGSVAGLFNLRQQNHKFVSAVAADGVHLA